VIQFVLLCSKHVKDRSVTYILLKNKGIVHYVCKLLGKIKSGNLLYVFRLTLVLWVLRINITY